MKSLVRSALTKLPLKVMVLMLMASGGSVWGADSPGRPPPSPLNTSIRFVTSGSQDLWPCFSPDGARILFSRRVGQTWGLFVVPAAGGAPQALMRSALPVAATRANWSRQSNSIAFTGTSSRGDSRIWIVNPDGSSPHELASQGLSAQFFYPSWFPGAREIAVMDAQALVIKRMDLDAGTAVTITDRQQVLTGMPSVSPDGRWIAFAGQQNTGQKYDQTKNSVWLIDAGGGEARTLESKPGQGRAPTWSPDGKRLAFESDRASSLGQYAIFLIDRDGTRLTQVTDPVLNADHPVWSPDGRQLVFSARASLWANGRSIGIIDVPDYR